MKKFLSGSLASVSVIARITAVARLLWALEKHPYGYYKLLRWVVCGASAYAGSIAFEDEHKKRVWIFGIIAVLFNPIIPVHLDRDTWAAIDLATAGVLAVSLYAVREKRPPAQKSEK